jgi:hypothetical protein
MRRIRLIVAVAALALPALAPVTSPAATDTQAPHVTITAPTNNEILIGRPIVFTGTASDDVGVTFVRIWMQRFDCPDFDCPYNLGRQASCDGCTFPSAPGQTINWRVPGFNWFGYFVARAEARDAAGHVAYSENVYYFIVDGGISCDVLEIFDQECIHN